MTIEPRYQTPLVLAALGLVFFAVGVYAVAFTHHQDTGLAGKLRAAPVVDSACLPAHAVGTTVLVEGRVPAANPVIEGGLVTLLHEEADAVSVPGQSELRIAWNTVRSEARPLLVDTRAGALAIVVNADHTFREVPRRVPGDPGLVTPGKQRVAGFAAVDTIVAHATVVTHKVRPALNAVEADAGDLAAYLASKPASGLVGTILGGAFALVGLGLLASAAVGIRRAPAEPAPALSG